MASIGIAGAGLLGRLLAWQLSNAGHRVTVFDPAAGPEPTFDGHQAAAFSAAGMLSPLAEMESATAQVARLGWRSIGLWREIVAKLDSPRPSFSACGSLLLAHRHDRGAAQRALARLSTHEHAAQPLDATQLRELEPALHGAAWAWLLPGEAQIDPVAAMFALHRHARDVRWNWRQHVERVDPGTLTLQRGGSHICDLAFDVRGTGARQQGTPGAGGVRGVRGETVWLHSRTHGLTRPVRLLHPRHRVYLVPRDQNTVFVGASEIESEDRSPVSLRSAVELMAAAHSVMPALAEARIVRLDRNLRPAYADNAPRCEVSPGLVRINGLFRHGWLLAPALVQAALQALFESTPSAEEIR